MSRENFSENHDGETSPLGQPLTGQSEEVSVSEPEDNLPAAVLEGLPESARNACARAGWRMLTRVQSLGLPYLLNGRDIMVQSRTGSGKTGCYLLPLLTRLDPDIKAAQALVLTPTRELAVQVAHEAQTLFSGTGISTVAVYGGVGYKQQTDTMRSGAQLIVGTPGRVLDHLMRRTMNFDELRCLIFDEADRLLSIGFYPDMKEVQRCLPSRPIHTCMFSATYPPHVLRLAEEFMRQPAMLSLSLKQIHVVEVGHFFCEVPPMDKDRALVRLLEMENPVQAMIFCNTKANVHYVTGVLQGFGYSADEISSDLSQGRREEVLGKIRSGRLRYLIATDVAARGIDIPALSHVFLYEPPEDHESYIHRAGRTGRAGAAGTVISLVDVMQRMELERIARHYGISMTQLPLPTDGDVERVAGARAMALLEARLRKLTGLERLRAERYMALARELASGEEDGGPILLAMLLDNFHRNALQEECFPRAGLSEPGGTAALNHRSEKDGRGNRKRRSRRRRGENRGPDSGDGA
ncbi:MAG: DEAD/DEAH box helicase [Desulfovibrio sp.]|nr:DEAD/DEAH box helicase [Desulfovibrio sp.]